MNGRCGRCKGRGRIKGVIGFGDRVCPDCEGSGIKKPKRSLGTRTVSVPLNGARCLICELPAVHNHHVVSQQRLERFVGPKDRAQRAKGDKRNVVPLCNAHHCEIESGKRQLDPDRLPYGFWLFIADYDLFAALPRHLQEVAS